MNQNAFRIWATLALVCSVLVGAFLETGNAQPIEAELIESPEEEPEQTVVVIPIRENIMPPLVYLVRRSVKEAIRTGADAIVLDMETDGGRVDVTEEIIRILAEFEGRKGTFVNRRAFSAGAFISVATHEIYMAPQSVIGAAAPIMMAPGGGAAEIPTTVEAKMTSAIKALIRAQAEFYGHNTDVVEAMIDKGRRLEIDGEVLCEEGEILTLTNTEAEAEYGEPASPLLSRGTLDDIDAVVAAMGFEGARVIEVEPTGSEKLARWLDTVSSILLIVGLVGLYLEFKTPGFGLPGLVGIIAIGLYFLGSYVGGFSGIEWLFVFLVGLILLGIEFFVLPGTVVVGLVGAALMVVSVAIAFMDYYPESQGPAVVESGEPAPSVEGDEVGAPGGLEGVDFQQAFIDRLGELSVSGFIAAGILLVLARILPSTPIYQHLVSTSASGMETPKARESRDREWLGREGVSISILRPAGKVEVDGRIMDVVSDGEMIPAGERVRIDDYRNGVNVVTRV